MVFGRGLGNDRSTFASVGSELLTRINYQPPNKTKRKKFEKRINGKEKERKKEGRGKQGWRIHLAPNSLEQRASHPF